MSEFKVGNRVMIGERKGKIVGLDGELCNVRFDDGEGGLVAMAKLTALVEINVEIGPFKKNDRVILGFSHGTITGKIEDAFVVTLDSGRVEVAEAHKLKPLASQFKIDISGHPGYRGFRFRGDAPIPASDFAIKGPTIEDSAIPEGFIRKRFHDGGEYVVGLVPMDGDVASIQSKVSSVGLDQAKAYIKELVAMLESVDGPSMADQATIDAALRFAHSEA